MKIRLTPILLFYFLFSASLFAEEGVTWDSLSADQQNVLKDFKDS